VASNWENLQSTVKSNKTAFPSHEFMKPARTALRIETLAVFLVASALASLSVPAQAPMARLGKQYRVQIRYQLVNSRSARLAQFGSLAHFLKSIGFERDLGLENEAEDLEQTSITGTIASSDARRILAEPHVKAILLMPVGYAVPAETEKPVKVQLDLRPGLMLGEQRQLAEQTRTLLEARGFQEAIGYDHKGYTRLAGTIPAGELKMLLEDLRWQGSGWLAPDVPASEIANPLKNAWPLAVAEITPEPDGVTPAKQGPAAEDIPNADDSSSKIDSNLRTLAARNEQLRMEVILASIPTTADDSWRRALEHAAPGSSVEGRLGPLVTLKARANHAASLASLPGVITLRLPRPAVSVSLSSPLPLERNPKTPQGRRLDGMKLAGQRGRGLRVAVIDDDFRGHERYLGKGLSTHTRYVDITAQCDPDIRPEGFSGASQRTEPGMQCALDMARAVPDAELTLVRVDRRAPYQLEAVASYINGDAVRSECLMKRREELSAENERVQRIREKLLEDRKAILDKFGQDTRTAAEREAYFDKQRQIDKEEQELQRREERFLKLETDLRGLKGIQVVACPLVWAEGYPLGGSSPLTRYFDDRPFRAALWFQATGDTRGRAWSGLFRDVDGNGVMEFAPPETPLKSGRWTSELDFLAWQPVGKQPVPELPKSKLRVSIQWREPHDPELAVVQADPYRVPLANLRLMILRQRDPSGTTLPVDEMEVVARSAGLPLRLDSKPSSSTYEQTVEFSVEDPGRYAVRVEGRIPAGLRPTGEASLPSSGRMWELRPRLFVSQLDEHAGGRPIFADYATESGDLGMPADSHEVIDVGAADFGGRSTPSREPQFELDNFELRPKDAAQQPCFP
jgi:hypothetical protein